MPRGSVWLSDVRFKCKGDKLTMQTAGAVTASVHGLDTDQIQLLCEVRLGAGKFCMACKCDKAHAGHAKCSRRYCINGVSGFHAVQVQLLYQEPAGVL